MAIAPISWQMYVPCEPARAFDTFVLKFRDWWPAAFSWSGDVLEDIGFEPREGGFAYEHGPHGFTVHWGRVSTWRPPQELRFLWQISMKRQPVPNPELASEVIATFEPEAGGTRFHFEHRGFERHGEDAEGYRDALAGAWPGILEGFVRCCANELDFVVPPGNLRERPTAND